jgi:nucleotide-binding universal stress UspA family protein
MTIHSILVPVDFSGCSSAAVDTALDLARLTGARLTLVNAYGVPVTWLPDGGAYVPTRPELAELERTALGELEPVRRRLAEAGVAVEARAVEGPPAETIVQAAREAGADLIVMGTHGRTGLKHLLLGSVAERVLRTAACPVLTVRGPAEKASPKLRVGAPIL